MMYECDTCTRTFGSDRARAQHMNALDHWADESVTFESETDQYSDDDNNNYCSECDRYFQNNNNLRMHLRSRTHIGGSVSCPFCQTNFTTASGVAHHVEAGSCKRAPQLNRENIWRAVRERDPNGYITQKQLEWHDSPAPSAWDPERAWNGRSRLYECYICHHGFATASALRQHVNSPVHQQKLYRCPNRRCDRPFATLAATFNHLESESCGYLRFEQVQRGFSGIVSGRQRLIGFN